MSKIYLCYSSCHYAHSHFWHQFHTDPSIGVGWLQVIDQLKCNTCGCYWHERWAQRHDQATKLSAENKANTRTGKKAYIDRQRKGQYEAARDTNSEIPRTLPRQKMSKARERKLKKRYTMESELCGEKTHGNEWKQQHKTVKRLLRNVVRNADNIPRPSLQCCRCRDEVVVR